MVAKRSGDPISEKAIDIKHLLERWMINSKRSGLAHFRCANRFSGLNVRFGVPVVLCSSVVGVSVFATLDKSVDPRLRLVLGLISVAAAVLASLQTYLGYGELASKHRAVAAEYGSIKRQVQEALATRAYTLETAADLVSSIRRRMDLLAMSAPQVPKKLWSSAHKEIPEPEGEGHLHFDDEVGSHNSE